MPLTDSMLLSTPAMDHLVLLILVLWLCAGFNHRKRIINSCKYQNSIQETYIDRKKHQLPYLCARVQSSTLIGSVLSRATRTMRMYALALVCISCASSRKYLCASLIGPRVLPRQGSLLFGERSGPMLKLAHGVLYAKIADGMKGMNGGIEMLWQLANFDYEEQANGCVILQKLRVN
eukprot:6184201-Pleurochrysis_carterae.AAC.3